MTTLQKIKAEIEEPLRVNNELGTESAKAQNMALLWVLEIIDKYASEECDNDCEHCAYLECPKEPTTLKQIIEKHNMDKLAYDEMSDFERDVLKYAEQEPKSCEKCLYAEETDGSHCYECVKGESKFEQEPCEDAVSRESAILLASIATISIDETVEAIKRLPSVQPKAKMGRWIYSDDAEIIYDTYWCSECRRYITVDHKRTDDIGFVIEDMDYCPRCGAKMVEPQERSDKE